MDFVTMTRMGVPLGVLRHDQLTELADHELLNEFLGKER
jgi:hypothetical protein